MIYIKYYINFIEERKLWNRSEIVEKCGIPQYLVCAMHSIGAIVKITSLQSI